MPARPGVPLLAAALALSAPPAARAAELATYAAGAIPVAAAAANVEFPVGGDFRGELGTLVLGQGTYDDHNPFQYLSLVAPWAWLHFDGVRNLRLSVAFEEFLYAEVPPLGLPSGHEERLALRARLQQPRGEGALYELLQLDVRSFVDPGGTHRWVYRPRFRIGQGFNLDAVHIHSIVLYQEVALRYAEDSYSRRAFEFFRAFIGYTGTTRRGVFVTLGLVGQVTLNPAATRLDLFYGPVLAFTYRVPSPRAEAAPPQPSEVELH
ncbi:MAG TPA: hypothetical protein VML50_08055 [Anaeromyxobacter sp.]|nr:hypothetical protein [Anaeromyxobacter sp.]